MMHWMTHKANLPLQKALSLMYLFTLRQQQFVASSLLAAATSCLDSEMLAS